MICNWPGRVSVTTTLVTETDPGLVTISVQVTVSPGEANVGSTDLVTTGSATSRVGVGCCVGFGDGGGVGVCWRWPPPLLPTVTVAVAELWPLATSLAAVTVAVLRIGFGPL